MERNALRHINARARRLARAAVKANPNELRRMQRELKSAHRDLEVAK